MCLEKQVHRLCKIVLGNFASRNSGRHDNVILAIDKVHTAPPMGLDCGPGLGELNQIPFPLPRISVSYITTSFNYQIYQ